MLARYYGYHQSHGLTFDEGLYADLIAEQLKDDPGNYSTQEAYQRQVAQGVKVPEYLNRPLFKHPPLYNYLIALNYKLFGSGHLSAVSVSIIFGCLMIPVVFLLGKELYDERVGLLAALLLCADPVHWVCSEKIWMETTLSFFILLSALLFIYGRKRPFCLLLSGVAVGLAMLTKYPGLLPLLIIVTYVVWIERTMIRKKGFWLLCLSAVIVFIPWIIWNWKVYGRLFDPVFTVHGIVGNMEPSIQSLSKHTGLILAGLMGGIGVIWGRKKIVSLSGPVLWGAGLTVLVIALIAVPFFRGLFIEAFVWKETILVGWSNPFTAKPWPFYLSRLTELSPLYLYSFLTVIFLPGGNKGDQFLLLASFWILGAFIVLGNYQSRYILPAVPFLILLSSRFQIFMYDKLSPHSADAALSGSNSSKTAAKYLLILLTAYFFIKTLRTDWLIAIGPDFGYF